MLVTIIKPETHPNRDTELIPAVIKKPHCDMLFKIDSKGCSDFKYVLLYRYAGNRNKNQIKLRDTKCLRIAL